MKRNDSREMENHEKADQGVADQVSYCIRISVVDTTIKVLVSLFH